MADVARLASVSSQTVSRYFTGTGYVSADTRERIAAAVEELRYHPNYSARTFRTQRTKTIGVLALGGLNYGSAGLLTGLSRSARAVGYALSINQLDVDFHGGEWRDEATAALERFLSMPVDGVVLSTPILGADDLFATLTSATPHVTISERPPSDDVSVGTHSYTAGLVATEHLASLGHRRIIHIAGPATRNESSERERGYRDAMVAIGEEPAVIRSAFDWSAASGHAAGMAVEELDFTAAFAANDEIALGFMSAMRQRGRSAPDDYSIVGVDDMPSAAYFAPPLTTLRLDFDALGVSTFEMLHELIETGERAEPYVMEPQLVVRESTAPAPGAALPTAERPD
jgi:DNA-binding LacI/PurR family transcriptional regulator